MKVLEVGRSCLGRESYGLGHLERGLEERGKLQVMFHDIVINSLMVSSHPTCSLQCIRENF